MLCKESSVRKNAYKQILKCADMPSTNRLDIEMSVLSISSLEMDQDEMNIVTNESKIVLVPADNAICNKCANHMHS